MEAVPFHQHSEISHTRQTEDAGLKVGFEVFRIGSCVGSYLVL